MGDVPQRSGHFPLFPLHAVLLPGSRMSLKIFEPRYLTLIRECLSAQASFGVVLISAGSEIGAGAQVCTLGTEAQIVDFSQTEQGLLGITVLGGRRFEVLESWTEDDRLYAQVRFKSSEEVSEVPPEFGLLKDLLVQIFHRHPELATLHPQAQFDDANWVSWRLAEVLPFSAESRQEMLACDNAWQRFQMITDLFPDLQSERGS